jgi:urease accessory protein
VVTPQLIGSPWIDPAASARSAAEAASGDTAIAGGGSSAAGHPRNRVVASAAIVAEAFPGGGTRLPVLRSQAPLVLRRTPDAVYVVGGAAGPIGGDTLDLRIEVRDGATLRVRTAAAAVALPGLDGLESVLTVAATVGPGARLEYLPEPVVVAAGARHATIIQVTLAEGASLLLRDELILGRHGEPGGASRTSLRVDYAGRPLLRQALEVSGTDPASLGSAILAGHRAAGTLLYVDPAIQKPSVVNANPGSSPSTAPHVRPAPGPGPAPHAGPEVAVMPLAGPGILVTALAHDAVTLRYRLEGTTTASPVR